MPRLFEYWKARTNTTVQRRSMVGVTCRNALVGFGLLAARSYLTITQMVLLSSLPHRLVRRFRFIHMGLSSDPRIPSLSVFA
jgi:hypothetical protein